MVELNRDRPLDRFAVRSGSNNYPMQYKGSLASSKFLMVLHSIVQLIA